MLFKVATAAVALCAASASAIALPQNAGNSAGSNMCDASTFNNGADLDIPQANAKDCTDLVAGLDTSQTWSVSKSWARLSTQGTCAFSVRVIAGSKDGLVGGADLADLVNDSVNNFQQSGQVSCKGQFGQVVSAEGEVDCNTPSGGSQVRVEWVIAASSYNPSN
ncbi:hypothetical protein CB0940_02263 [Cercospora beticola]|uniref:Ecp2 effector protein-like domain-containing protein n=1 Tax=Cercospora beticola TaxID=122368 RepID=A0A2G5I4J3_CERBT|nr:hypothetical protein CB0940_02263 [Cercospora beticola]PIA99719.1 hypothetical protein CB0940_02263 [Cercospora beticola]WPA99381.1 hypothetical protein RHO25_003998 [Cercospora beticola]CAK1362498.1 unnamed protein product [Cercospora beticola]